MRYFLHLAYQGTNYSGWQRQTTASSIQQVIEDSISKMLKKKVFIHGCGRTDAGVHSKQYFAHIDINQDLNFDFIGRINHILPPDISIYELIPMEDFNHAQYDAITRTYIYDFHIKKIPALAATSAYYNMQNLDLSLMYNAIEILKKTIDFKSLCKNPDLYKHTKCKISSLELHQRNEFEFSLEISADRFLRGMIRYIAARLLDIGSNKLSLEEFSSTLSINAEFDFKFQKQGFPQGLYLYKIEYPYLTRKVID